MTAPVNFLAAEPAIIQRVKDQVAGLAGVMSAMDLLQVKDWSQIAPAVHVIFGGVSVKSDADNPLLIKVVQQWVLWLLVRNVSAGRATEAARGEAGPYLAQIIAALHGWRPIAQGQVLVLASSPSPVTARTKDDKFSGGMLFPLVFNLPIPIRGES